MQYCSDCFYTLLFLINRLPTQVLSNVYPHEKLFGKVTDYSLLRVFGCMCFPFNQPFNNTNWIFYPTVYFHLLIKMAYSCLHQLPKICVPTHLSFLHLVVIIFPSDNCVASTSYPRTSTNASATVYFSGTSPSCSFLDQSIVHSELPSHIAESAHPFHRDHSFHFDTITMYVPSTSKDLAESTRFSSNPTLIPSLHHNLYPYIHLQTYPDL